MQTQMELDEVVKRSFSLLGKILDASIASKNDDSMQTAFVYRHASNIFHLGKDTIYLLETGHSYSCPVVARVMLESLFKLVAALKTPDVAVQIIISETEEECDRITKWLDPAVYTSIAEDNTKMAQHLRKEYGITSTKRWNTLACAEAAQLDGHYRDAYFHLSSHTHATITGIEIQEKTASAGYVLQIIIFIVLTAALYTAHVVQSNSLQEQTEECKKLGDEWMRLMDAGVFKKMDEA